MAEVDDKKFIRFVKERKKSQSVQLCKLFCVKMSQEFLQPLFVFMQILVSFLLSYFKAVLLQAARSQREVGGSHGRK